MFQARWLHNRQLVQARGVSLTAASPLAVGVFYFWPLVHADAAAAFGDAGMALLLASTWL